MIDTPLLTPLAAAGWAEDKDGKLLHFPWDVSSLLIPEFSGQGTMTGQLQSATIKRYLALSAVGLSMFYFSSQSSVRTAGLSLLFPGAGCLAAGGIAGTLGFLVSVAFLPVALFAWFGAGGLAFPLADWVLSGIFATWLAGRRTAIVESSPIVTLGLLAVIFTYCKTRSITEEEGELAAKARRNRFLERADKEWRANARPASLPGSRELSLEQLRFVQHSLELMMKDHNDWEGHTIVDQFQPAALRYQFYETLYMLATYGTIYTPCFQGYLSAAMQNAIEKSLTPRVMGFWRLETLWGKFSTNYDPVIKDNIMVTGYMALAISLYQSVTGDDRYGQDGSLDFQITSKIRYKHSLRTIYEALIQNWDGSKFILYPCEPNWIYSVCNLQGIAGALAYDRLHDTNEMTRVLKGLHRHLEEDFATKGGSSIPIKSALTGFTIPGLTGVLGIAGNALYCSPTMPAMAKRLWLIVREENVDLVKGEVKITGLKGADSIDVGNYKPRDYGAYAVIAPAAAEWGDHAVARGCLEKFDNLTGVSTNQLTGAKFNENVSTLVRAMTTRARIMEGGDWARVVSMGREKSCVEGPVLADCPYPQVLVAKAYSHTSKDLDLVLYPGKTAGRFDIRLSKLGPGVEYTGQHGQKFTADEGGSASLTVDVEGRTQIAISPTSA